MKNEKTFFEKCFVFLAESLNASSYMNIKFFKEKSDRFSEFLTFSINKTLTATKARVLMTKNLHFSHNSIAPSMNKVFVIRFITIIT